MIRATREDDIRQLYLAKRAGITWVPHSHPGWWAVRARLGDRVWEIELRYRNERSG